MVMCTLPVNMHYCTYALTIAILLMFVQQQSNYVVRCTTVASHTSNLIGQLGHNHRKAAVTNTYAMHMTPLVENNTATIHHKIYQSETRDGR